MTPYLFLLPALILLTISAFYPLLAAVGLSFTSYDFVGAIEFVGGRNYQAIWSDRLFWQVLGNTLSYLVIVVPALVTLPLGLAILVNHKLRGMALFRSIYYLPVLVSVVIAAIAWQWIYSETGLLNYLLTSLFGRLVGGSVQIPWLSNPNTAILAIALVIIWRGLGYYMAIYLAGLQAIPPELYEAAAIDGSDGWRKHWDITLPLMLPYTFLVGIVSTINGLKIFEEVYIMTKGGPANSSKTIIYYLYDQGFTNLELGYACAIAVVLFSLVALLSLGVVGRT